MFDEAELARMSPEQRARLARILAGLDAPGTLAGRALERRQRLMVAATVTCALILAAWIGVLAVTLPPYYRSGGWRAAWVGFDLGLLLVFLATAWAIWRRRQILIVCLIVLATLLSCDAWFDTMLDFRTRGFVISLLSALLVELPLAGVALIGARRLLRVTVRRMESLEGACGPVPPFWRVPLFGNESTGYRHVLPRAVRDVAWPADSRMEQDAAGPGEAAGPSGGAGRSPSEEHPGRSAEPGRSG
jgi:hypothetical protein